jgi:hypothetical protein
MTMSPDFAAASQQADRLPPPHKFKDVAAVPGVAALIFEGEEDGDRLTRLNVAYRMAIADVQAVIAAHNAAPSAERTYNLDWASSDLLHSLASLGAEIVLSGLNLLNSSPSATEAAPATETLSN